jgi:hypothetical protein
MMAITTSSSTNVKPERVPSFIAQFLSQKKRLRREADVRRSLSLLANGSTVDARRENFATNRRRCREKCAKVGRRRAVTIRTPTESGHPGEAAIAVGEIGRAGSTAPLADFRQSVRTYESRTAEELTARNIAAGLARRR